MPKPILLYVDDEQPNLDVFNRVFRFDYDVQTALSGAEGLEVLRKNPGTAVVIADQRMPGMTGIEFLKEVQAKFPYAQRLMLTAYSDNDVILAAIREGHVFDYVVKPWDKDALKKVIDAAIAVFDENLEKTKRLKIAEAKVKMTEDDSFSELIGADGGLKGIIEKIKKVAPTLSTVLIRGESGTGKELVARAIHQNSLRKKGSFIKVNCAALSPQLLESELFGHEKGSFTGALSQKIGRFELADGGTLFLDEIGDLPEAVQVKLLRVLQEREIERVGGIETIQVDLRLVCATHQNLEKKMAEGKFREDLFFRINVIPLTMPALRDRMEDIPSLAAHFAQKFSTQMGKKIALSAKAVEALKDYDWPGNIRELSNIIERAVVLSDGPEIDVTDLAGDLSHRVQAVKEAEGKNFADIRDDIGGDEARELAAAMKKCRGNISLAARELGLARSTLVHRLKKQGLIE